jgi:hypothetical protein
MLSRKFFFIQKYVIISFLILGSASCLNSSDEYKFGKLSSLALGKTDKAMDWHGFTELYEHIFYPLKNKPIRIFEIGIKKGGSLILWRDYFPNATVFGIDIVDVSELNSERIKTFIADQADRDQLKLFIEKHGGDFNIILDDGGHTMEQQQISLGYLFKYVQPGGYYVVEDVHTSLTQYYPARFGVDEDQGNSTLVMINEFIRNGVIKSMYFTSEEADYLKENIELIVSLVSLRK